MNHISTVSRLLVLKLVRVYQKTLSLDHGFMRHLTPANGRCKFYPTCSEYGYQSIERFGIFCGGLMAFRRVLRCHPFSKGGVDEVPK